MYRSIKTNFIYSLINTISGILFPLLTFPYASRILLADGIGKVSFYSSIISYISLFTCLGIPMYAIREIARVRNNDHELAKTTAEIVILLGSLIIVGYIIVGVICLTITQVQSDIPLFLVLSTSIAFTAIGVEWFYQGTEDFKYITIRGLIIKTIAMVWLFMAVKDRSDLLCYAIYTVIGSVGNNLLNFIRLPHLIKFQTLKFAELNPLRHLKPALRIFMLNITTSIYVNLDSVMLGFIRGDAAVGYYTAASKLTKIILAVATSLGTVTLPRLSNLFETGQFEQFRHLAQKTMDFILTLCLPFMVGVIILAPALINILSGSSYEPAVITLQILSPIIVIIAISNITGIQILYPQGKENIVIVSTLIGAIVNFTINMLLIPRFAQNGAAFATVIAETCVTLVQLVIGRRFIPVKIISRNLLITIIGTILVGICCIFIANHVANDILSILLSAICSIPIYYMFLLLCRHSLTVELTNNIFKR